MFNRMTLPLPKHLKEKELPLPESILQLRNPSLKQMIESSKCYVIGCPNRYFSTIEFHRETSGLILQVFKYCEDHAPKIGDIVLNEIAIFNKEGN
jgi:hypothetical protein